MSAIYDFFLADIHYEAQKAPWTHFSSGCFSGFRTIFGGRKIQILDGSIKNVEQITIRKSDVRWIEIALSILGLLVAFPLGIFPRIFTFFNHEIKLQLSNVHLRDQLALMHQDLLDENDKFPQTTVQWSIFQFDNHLHPERFDPFIKHFERVDDFSRKVCASLVRESKGDQQRMVKLLKSHQFHHYFYTVPRQIYGSFRDGSIAEWLFVPGTPQYKIRVRFNELTDLWNRILGDYDPNFKFSKDEEPHVAHESEIEVAEFKRIFLGIEPEEPKLHPVREEDKFLREKLQEERREIALDFRLGRGKDQLAFLPQQLA